jgi:flagellar P-ring protein precursor FlgI
MYAKIKILLPAVLLGLALCGAEVSGAKVGDLTELKGVQDNQLFGIGLVMGLNKTGDGSAVTRRVISNLLKTQYLQVDPQEVSTGNMALVMVTATLPPFVRCGGKIDVTVSSIGDAKSLFGGTLLMTPLKGPDSHGPDPTVYAVAQGPLTIGGFSATGKATRVEKNHPTVGLIPSGAIVEAEVPVTLLSKSGNLCFFLKQHNFTTAERIEAEINKLFPETALAVDGGTILVKAPGSVLRSNGLTRFVSRINNLDVKPFAEAKVVINERTGTIVAGENVKIGVVAISHGSLNVYVKESPKVSQPTPYSKGKTVVVPDTEVDVAEEDRAMTVIEGDVSVAKVAEGLNALGVSPRDLVAIFEGIKRAGALYADLVIL